MSETSPIVDRAKRIPMRRLRVLLLVVLAVGLSAFAGVTLVLIANLSQRFGPEVRADLEWRAARGARELARASDVGLAVDDGAVVMQAFGAYATSQDVLAIHALDANGKPVASHGTQLPPETLFGGAPGEVTSTAEYISSWAPAEIEGVTVGKVAIAVSTRRLRESQAQLQQVKHIVLGAGLVGLVLGAFAILWFTRSIATRDRQLVHYANNLQQMVVLRTAELDERNGEMRLVLDTVAQGFVMIDMFGRMATERSAVVDTWFGEPQASMTIMSYLEPHAPEFAAWFELALSTLRDGLLPADICMAQMPQRLRVGGRVFAVSCRTVFEEDMLARILVVIDDVTEQVVRERSEREQREMLALFMRIATDRSGVDELLTNVSELLGSLAKTSDSTVERRILHTLKGNCAVFGLELYSELCHTIESELAETLEPLSAAQRTALEDSWAKVTAWVGRLRGATRDDVVEVEKTELARVIERAEQGVSGYEIAAALSLWTLEPIARRFERLAQHAQGLARRLGKDDLDVTATDNGVRLDGTQWAGFWAAAVHAVRNAVDHGIEPPDERVAAGKPPGGRLSFAATQTADEISIAITDDGAGLAWDAIRERARAAGMPHATEADLIEALFTDGVTTRDDVSETSGRGVGMAALRQAVRDLGGRVHVSSVAGNGTTITFHFPAHDPARVAVRRRAELSNVKPRSSRIPALPRDIGGAVS